MTTTKPEASGMAPGSSSIGTTDRSTRLTASGGLVLVVLALALFIAASVHDDHLAPSSAQIRFTMSVLQLLGMFLAFSGLVVGAASMQRELHWSERLKLAGTACLVGGVLIYGFVGLWLVWETNLVVAAWWLIPIFGFGFMLAILVTISISGVVLASRSASGSGLGEGSLLATAVFGLGGLVLILSAMLRTWASGLQAMISLIGRTRRPAGALELFTYDPIVITLGTLACVFAANRRWPGRSSRAHLAAALAYVIGSVLFALALLDRTRHLETGAFGGIGTVGMAILSISLIGEARPRKHTASGLVMGGDLHRIAGTALIVVVLWSWWYGQGWHAPVDAIAPSRSSALGRLGSSYAATAMPLGGLLVALGSWWRGSQSSSCLGFGGTVGMVLGAACLALGFYSGVGVLAWWRLDVTTVVGAAILVMSLLVDLVRSVPTQAERSLE